MGMIDTDDQLQYAIHDVLVVVEVVDDDSVSSLIPPRFAARCRVLGV